MKRWSVAITIAIGIAPTMQSYSLSFPFLKKQKKEQFVHQQTPLSSPQTSNPKQNCNKKTTSADEKLSLEALAAPLGTLAASAGFAALAATLPLIINHFHEGIINWMNDDYISFAKFILKIRIPGLKLSQKERESFFTDEKGSKQECLAGMQKGFTIGKIMWSTVFGLPSLVFLILGIRDLHQTIRDHKIQKKLRQENALANQPSADMKEALELIHQSNEIVLKPELVDPITA